MCRPRIPTVKTKRLSPSLDAPSTAHHFQRRNPRTPRIRLHPRQSISPYPRTRHRLDAQRNHRISVRFNIRRYSRAIPAIFYNPSRCYSRSRLACYPQFHVRKYGYSQGCQGTSLQFDPLFPLDGREVRPQCRVQVYDVIRYRPRSNPER